MANGTSYRRGSVFGALLLIAVGGLFLYANFTPEFNPWPAIALYWPVLIIFWGLSKLVDYLMLRGRPEAAAATRIGAGSIVGLIFLILIGTAFSRAMRGGWWEGAPIVIGGEEIGCLLGNRYEFTEELIEEDIAAGATLRVRNLRGNLTLTPGDAGEILLMARKSVCAASEDQARRVADSYVLVLEGAADGYEIRWDTPSGTGGFVGAELQLQVPVAVNLKLSNRRGDVRLSGTRGNVEINLRRGDVFVENVDGDVRVDLSRGDVRIADVTGKVNVEGRGGEVQVRNIGGAASVEGSFYGPIRLAAIAGPVRFVSRRTTFEAPRIDGSLEFASGEVILRGVPGDVTLLTRDKEIEIEGVSGKIRVENRNGRIVLRAPASPTQPIDIQNRSGDIELVLPTASGFEISARVRNGEIESDFTGPGLTLEREERGTQTLRGTYGARRTSIRLSTSHGTIYLRRES
ncbi:MAG: DUF4097 family beta strand repeat protein [Acidobacteria bacterium]|nr:DUF4097 family beta strand repeat protein [Acidobacteriota bacterium]